MKTAFIVLVLLHGFIHLAGFGRHLHHASPGQFSGAIFFHSNRRAAEVIRLLWLSGFLLFLLTGLSLLFHKSWWWLPAAAAVVLSQFLIIMAWKDAKAGTIVNMVILFAAISSYGQWQLDRKVRTDTRLMLLKAAQHHRIVTAEMLTHLPEPVKKWLLSSGIVGMEQINTVRLKQRGMMRMKRGSDKWIPMQAEQYFTIEAPAFIWKVRMNMMPLVPVAGRDQYREGKGYMQMKVLGLFNIVNESGNKKIDQGTLQRYLSEICWFPSAALSPYIHWEAIDSLSAKARMAYKGVEGSVIFHFDTSGRMTGVHADRYMGSDEKATLEKWEVRSMGHETRNGILIPLRSEVTWKLKDGDYTWFRLEITEIGYNKPMQ